jgi:predicted metalloprotease
MRLEPTTLPYHATLDCKDLLPAALLCTQSPAGDRQLVHRGRFAPLWHALALFAFFSLIAVGCGSSESGSQSTTTATTGSTSRSTDASTIEGEELGRMPTVPEPTGSPPLLSGTSTADTRTYLKIVFDDAQALWQREFAAANRRYVQAQLTLFSQAVKSSGCGAAAATGPFYCTANHGIYLDLRFFQLLTQKFGAGRFAQAYIVGHEFGHHVQTLIGITHRLAVADQEDPAGKNDRSVRFELQADCLAGVWAHSVYRRGELTKDDLAHALRAAEVVGDDFRQRMAGHAVDTTHWTHGSSAQRQQWLKIGFERGEPGSCDAFGS